MRSVRCTAVMYSFILRTPYLPVLCVVFSTWNGAHITEGLVHNALHALAAGRACIVLCPIYTKAYSNDAHLYILWSGITWKIFYVWGCYLFGKVYSVTSFSIHLWPTCTLSLCKIQCYYSGNSFSADYIFSLFLLSSPCMFRNNVFWRTRLVLQDSPNAAGKYVRLVGIAHPTQTTNVSNAVLQIHTLPWWTFNPSLRTPRSLRHSRNASQYFLV